MHYKKYVPLVIGVILAILILSGLPALTSAQEHSEAELPPETRTILHEARGATAHFQDLEVALESGYGKTLDCFQHGPERGMGQHYVNGDLLSDDLVDPLHPEALVYEPREDGAMILVAFEYIILADMWDPDNEGREAPTLLGQELTLRTNIPETPPIWALHLWLWSHNPEGLFADYNPLIMCPQEQPITEMADS